MSDSECLALSVQADKNTSSIDPLGVGLGAFFGFLLGVLLGLLFSYICWRDPAGKKTAHEAEHGSRQKKKKGSKDKTDTDIIISHSNVDTKMTTKKTKRQKLKLKKKSGAGYTPLVEVLPISLEPKAEAVSEEKEDEQQEKTKGILESLVKQTPLAMDEEILSQDVDAISELQRESKEESIMTSIQLLRVLLGKELQKGSVSKTEVKSLLEEVMSSAHGVIEQVQTEREEEVAEIKKKFAKDATKQDDELQKLDGKYNNRLNELLSEEQRKMRQQLQQHTQLSTAEIEALLAEYSKYRAAADNSREAQRQRQLASLEDRLARRKRLAGLQQLEHSLTEQEKETDLNSSENMLQELKDKGQLTDRQIQELMAAHKQEIEQATAKRNQELEKQKLLLANKLREKHRKRSQELHQKQSKEKEDFHNVQVDQMTDAGDMLQDLQALEQRHRMERQLLDEELDQDEAKQFRKLQSDAETQLGEELMTAKKSLMDRMRGIAHLSENDYDKIIQKHQQEKHQLRMMKNEERKKQEAKLNEKIAKRRQKAAQEQAVLIAEQEAFKKQQDAAMARVLESYVDLGDKEKKKLLEAHNSNMVVINNQLELSRQKQHKELQRKLLSRRTKVEELQQKKKEAQISNQKNKEKIIVDLEKQIEQEEARIQKEKKDALNALRKRFAEETERALKDEEKHMSEEIARLQMGNLRRDAILKSREKKVKKLEDQIAKRLEGSKDQRLGDPRFDELYRQYTMEVRDLQERVKDAELRQRDKLQEKIQGRKLMKERQINEALEEEAQKDWAEKKTRGARIATDIVSRMLLQQRQEAEMKRLEAEQKWEWEREVQKLDQQLAAEMQEQLGEKKEAFLAGIVEISDMSEEDVMKLVNSIAESEEEEKELRKKFLRNLRSRAPQQKSRPGSAMRSKPKSSNDVLGILREGTQGRFGTPQNGHHNTAFSGSEEEF